MSKCIHKKAVPLLVIFFLSLALPQNVSARNFPLDTTLSISDSFVYNGKTVQCVFDRLPGSGKRPAIFLMQGFGCLPMTRLSATHPYKLLADYFARMGFIVMRSEKPGMNDRGRGCFELDYNQEIEGFKASYQRLLSRNDVDTGRIIIFGHSMGAIQAPYVASAFSPEGIIVYGTTIKNWYEYLLDMLRYQNPHSGVDYVDVDREMQQYPKALMDILIYDKPVREVVKSDSGIEAKLIRDFDYKGGEDLNGKHVRFSQTLQKANHALAWKNINTKVLSVYGEYDIQTLGDFSHKELVSMLNHYHPGNASLLWLPATDHQFLKLENQQQAYDLYADPVLMKTKRSQGPDLFFLTSTLKWIQEILR